MPEQGRRRQAMRFKIEVRADDRPVEEDRQRTREIEVANVDELADYFTEELVDAEGRPLGIGSETTVTRLAYERSPHSLLGRLPARR
jgi:hypothetical protein